MAKTLQEQITNIEELFSDRNDMYLPDHMRGVYVFEAVRKLGEYIRRDEHSEEKLGPALASIFSRTCTCAQAHKMLPVLAAMIEKFPSGRCAYGCGTIPCTCPPDRKKEIVHAEMQSSEQMSWTITDWCLHFHKMYGENNKKIGPYGIFLRLTLEVAEIQRIQLIEIHDRTLTPQDLRKRTAREIADVFAWTFGFANLFGIDLDQEISKRYGDIHKRCGNRPCTCGPFQRYIFEQ